MIFRFHLNLYKIVSQGKPPVSLDTVNLLLAVYESLFVLLCQLLLSQFLGHLQLLHLSFVQVLFHFNLVHQVQVLLALLVQLTLDLVKLVFKIVLVAIWSEVAQMRLRGLYCS